AHRVANSFYVSEVEIRPAELPVAATRSIEGEPLYGCCQFWQQTHDALKRVLRPIAEKCLRESQQALLDRDQTFECAVDGAVDSVRQGLLRRGPLWRVMPWRADRRGAVRRR